MHATQGVTLTIVAALVLAWSLFGRRLEQAGVTAPMVFLGIGVLLAGVSADIDAQTVRLLAEITLVIVLFHDASTVRLAELRADPWIAVRLLAVGFPIALAATAASTYLLLPAAGVAGAVLIAASITPTDAGLGAPTILNPVVPTRVRRALNVESGLNDGLATVLVESTGGEEQTILSLAAVPGALALAIGVLLGVVGAWLLDRSRDRGWSSMRARGIAVLLLPLLAFGLAELVEANAFIAAFVGGLLFGRFAHCVEVEAEVSETLEIAADLLSSLLWLLAGGLLVTSLEAGLTWEWLALAVLALTVLRVVPVALAMLGTGFRWPTVAFLGWFGPRGVATIVFGLLTVESLGGDDRLLEDVAGVLSVTVLLSVVLHGITAGPLSTRYGAWVARNHGPIETEPSVEPMPSRGRGGGRG